MSSTIWYISKYLGTPEAGRVGTRGFLILRQLARMGHRPVALTSDSNHLIPGPAFDGPILTRSIDGVEIHWIKTLKYKGAKSLGRILSWLDFEWRLWRMPMSHLPRPDAVIVSSLSLLTILNGLLLRRRYGCRLVFEVRDIWPLTIVEEGGFSPRNPFVMGLGWIERLAYRRSDAIVGTMNNLEEHVREQVGASPPVHCIPMGVDESMLGEPDPLPDDYREAHVPRGKFVVCHAGTIGITNALETLFACARDLKDHTDVHFLILGEGGLKAHFQALCADLPNVSFAPGVPKSQVQSVLRACDLLYFSVHPSRVWRYGMSLNKVIDYMLAAKPILASYTGATTMVEEADAGSITPAGDRQALKAEILRYAALTAKERQEIGSRGRDWLLRHRQYQTLAESYLAIACPESPGASTQVVRDAA